MRAPVTYRMKEEPSLERVVRPFEAPRGFPVNRRLPPLQEEQEAFLLWRASMTANVITLDAVVNTNGWRAFMSQPRDTETDEDEEQEDLIFQETARRTSEVRVTNPTNASQYVDVELVETVNFQANDGRSYQFRFSNRTSPDYGFL